jgi:hypothetical protein
MKKTSLKAPKDKNNTFKNFRVELLMEILSSIKPGETISYKELSRRCGFIVNGCVRDYQTARRRLILQGINVKTHLGIGVERLSDSGIVKESANSMASIGRKVRWEATKLSNSDPRNLTSEERTERNAKLGTFGAQNLFSLEPTQRRIEDKVRASGLNREIDTTKLLELFG